MALTKIPSSLLDTSGGFDLQGNITLGDNERIQFGDGTDLQIYHSGANSFITDTGTGNLNIKTNDGNGIYLLDATGNMADFTSGGAVTLRYNNDAKIATSSAGATITGTLTVTGDLDITGDINSYNVTDLDVTDQTITLGAGQTEANSGGSGIIIDGSNASILWDETNDWWDYNKGIRLDGEGLKLSFRTSSTSADGEIYTGDTFGSNRLIIAGENGIHNVIDGNANGVGDWSVYNDNTSTHLLYVTGSNGYVGIGDSSPNVKLVVSTASGDTALAINDDRSNVSDYTRIDFRHNNITGSQIKSQAIEDFSVDANRTSDLSFHTRNNGTIIDAMHIQEDGNVGIGTTSPQDVLHVKNSTQAVGDAQVILEGRPAGYGTGISFQAELTGGSLKEMARIVADGSASWNTTTTTQDARLRFFTTNDGTESEKMVISHAGNVGIGGTPTAKLAVVNNSNDATYTVKQYATFGTGATWLDSDVVAQHGGGIGEVQITNGEASRPAVLSLGGTLATGELMGVISFFRSSNSDGYRQRASIYSAVNTTGTANQHGGDLRFTTADDGYGSPSERMRITSDGRVGIGTTSPVSGIGLDVQAGTNKLRAGNIYVGSGGGSRIEAGNGQIYPGNMSLIAGATNMNIDFLVVVTGVGVNTSARLDSPTGDWFTNDGTVSSLSDERVKTDIQDLSDGLEIVKQLRPVTFKYNDNSEDENGHKRMGGASDKVRYGFIAQEVEEVAPQYVETGIGYVNNEEVNDFKSLSTTRMIPMLFKAIQELSAELDAAKARIIELENA